MFFRADKLPLILKVVLGIEYRFSRCLFATSTSHGVSRQACTNSGLRQHAGKPRLERVGNLRPVIGQVQGGSQKVCTICT